MRRRSSAPDDRGIETVLSHVLSVAITTLLIVGLVASATGYLDAQKQQAAAQELRSIGNKLASELATADRLARSGDSVELTSRQPETVAGSVYTASLVDCSSPVCLRISADNYDFSMLVPIENETTLSMTSRGGGRFRITSDGGASGPELDLRRLEMSPRVGIGRDVGVGPNLGVGTSLSRSPIAQFEFAPGVPQTGHQIRFDASDSRDPDGSIVSYEWDFDEDGTTDASGQKPTYAGYSDPGSHNVTLTVTDDGGLSNTYTREIDVSGLQYMDDLEVLPSDPQAVRFSLRNEYNRQIEIERIMIDPTASNLRNLTESQPKVCPWGWCPETSGPPYEIEIENMSSAGGPEGYVGWTNDDLDIPDGGAIVDIDQDGDENGNDVTLGDGDRVEITLRNFSRSVSSDSFTFGVRYRIDGSVDASAFTDKPS
jgi:PKD repeat protein